MKNKGFLILAFGFLILGFLYLYRDFTRPVQIQFEKPAKVKTEKPKNWWSQEITIPPKGHKELFVSNGREIVRWISSRGATTLGLKKGENVEDRKSKRYGRHFGPEEDMVATFNMSDMGKRWFIINNGEQDTIIRYRIDMQKSKFYK